MRLAICSSGDSMGTVLVVIRQICRRGAAKIGHGLPGDRIFFETFSQSLTNNLTHDYPIHLSCVVIFVPVFFESETTHLNMSRHYS